MISRPARLRSIALVALWAVVWTPAVASAQDVLSRARELYASAAYEDALQLLETVKDKPASTEASAYQVFCLVALGRRDEARSAIEAIVRVDPLFRPSDAQVSPRIRAFFDEVRTPLVPDMARASYAKGKAAFDQKDWAHAIAEFDRTLALLDESGAADPGAADLKTLTAGFRDLTRVAMQPPPPPPAPVASPAKPPEPVVYGAGEANVMRPLPISKPLPDWHPNPVEAKMLFSGEVELVIGEDGRVLSASIARSINARYDGPLLQAVKTWTFKPAMKDGVPVRYRYMVDVRLGK